MNTTVTPVQLYYFYAVAVFASADTRQIAHPWFTFSVPGTRQLNEQAVRQAFMEKFPALADHPRFMVNVLELNYDRWIQFHEKPEEFHSVGYFTLNLLNDDPTGAAN
jgi:hypothetical protein